MSRDKVRLSVDCSPEDRQKLKILCALKEESISKWVMDAVKQRMDREVEKLPNMKTQEALKESRKGKGVERHGTVEELFEDLGI